MITALIMLLVYILVLVIVTSAVLYVLKEIAPGEPFAHTARVIVLVIFLLVLILLVLQFAGINPPPQLR